MSKFLDNLRRKTDSQKRKITFLASGFITLIIFGVWIFTITSRIGAGPHPDESNQARSPIGGFVDNFKVGIGEIGNFIQNFRK